MLSLQNKQLPKISTKLVLLSLLVIVPITFGIGFVSAYSLAHVPHETYAQRN